MRSISRVNNARGAQCNTAGKGRRAKQQTKKSRYYTKDKPPPQAFYDIAYICIYD
ncbi:Hypothetical protein ETEE_2652 [Edwardsiella anguillarum ET080813]|uniref:Uncharacterized protein n=1 Tax=Edwardsiella anguillarum ET080813 TaxID=667120 RepID=A0A076LML7_9GAMM|nr:Hypothetical protein ETEE_2652 [Edwardsiella anguillarum ET080813]